MYFLVLNNRSYNLFIGCYNSSGIQTAQNTEIELSISSPPLCQEHCLQENKTLFAVQVCKLKFIKHEISVYSRNGFQMYLI